MGARVVLLPLFPLLLTTHSWSTSTSSSLFCYVVTSKATVKSTFGFILQAGRDKACHTSLINIDWLEETRFLCPTVQSPDMLKICTRKELSISVPGLLL